MDVGEVDMLELHGMYVGGLGGRWASVSSLIRHGRGRCACVKGAGRVLARVRARALHKFSHS